jgi:hypothetical protein
VVAAAATGVGAKKIMILDRFFQPAEYVELNAPAVSPEILRSRRFRGFDPLVDEINQYFVFFPVHLVFPAPVGFCAIWSTSALPGGILREVSRDDHQDDDAVDPSRIEEPLQEGLSFLRQVSP